ncbi:MAG TPA: hypothetical protein VGY97_07730 [Solirubrobacteraceae bacterium]|nr:hypothetical protein [Solirubrobacteraceae bacterium]
MPPTTWAKLGFAALVAVAAVGFVAYPTFPTYDSYYALVWGRDLLHGHLPAFGVYRAPTQHPLAIAFGALLSLAGHGADRLMVAATIASFVALAAGVYRLARQAFTPLIGAIAVALLCTRLAIPFLAVRGYLDIPYLALVIWAGVLEAERPRRGTPVFVLLAAAGLLRPEAWVITGLYFLWCAWPASWSQRLRYLALAAVGPVVWAAVDLAITGDPLYSLHSTSGLADELGRANGLSGVPSALVQFLTRQDHTSVLIGAGAGLVLAIWLCPRRMVVPGALLATGIGTFGLVGLAGLSIIDRYLLMPVIMVMVFAAVALGGWSMLRRDSRLRQVWLAGAVALTIYGVADAASTLSLHYAKSELSFRNDSHHALEALLANRRVRAALTCGPVSVPNHKLIPEVRWILGSGPRDVIARSQARTLALRGDGSLEARLRTGVAIYPTGQAVFREAIVDPGDDPIDQVPSAYFDRAATTQYYAAYVHC